MSPIFLLIVKMGKRTLKRRKKLFKFKKLCYVKPSESQWIINWRSHFKDYCNSTSIHGFKYFGENRSIFERLCWLVVIMASLSSCVLLIKKTYNKWESSPVIVSFATTETAIYNLPFPAVTICPEVKFRRRFYNFTSLVHKVMDNVTLDKYENKSMQYMGLICDDVSSFFNSDLLTNSNLTVTDEIFNFIKNATPNFFKYSFGCKWLRDEIPCDRFFTPIILDEGLCYTFNMLDRTEMFTKNVVFYGNYQNINRSSVDWDPEQLVYGTKRVAAYPRRALIPGANVAFSVILSTLKEDIDYACKDSLQGFRVLLHHPAKTPRMSYHYFRVPLERSVFAAVQPLMMVTSDNLKSYTPNIRGCCFPMERKLKYYRVYTQQNCLLECRANFTLGRCNCTPYYMPRFKNEPICGFGSLHCMEETEIEFLAGYVMMQFENDRKHFLNEADLQDLQVDCNCLPACTTVEYNVELSQVKWEWKKQFKAFRYNISTRDPNLNENNIYVSTIDIFFRTNQIIPLERQELYGPTDFLANFGGLLGLFTGFSILSLVEILYFLTLRLICNCRLYGKKYWPINTDAVRNAKNNK